MREDCGNGGPVESVEKQKQLFPSFHRPLEISQKRRDSHITTAPGGGPKLKPKTGREEDDGRGRGTMLMQRNTYRQAIVLWPANSGATRHYTAMARRGSNVYPNPRTE